MPSALLAPVQEMSRTGRMFAATWGQCRLFCFKKLLRVSRCGSGCSRFTWIQRLMHYPKKCNIQQEMTARSVKGLRGLDRRYCFRHPQRAAGWHLFIWENRSLHCQFSFFLAAKHPLSTPLFASQGCQVLKIHPTLFLSPEDCQILHFWEVEHDSDEQRFEEEICFSYSVWVYNGNELSLLAIKMN